MTFKVLTLFLVLISLLACRKVEEPHLNRATKNGGCYDVDSPFYDATIDYDDQSCVYAYTERYEISYHPEEDGGSDWDFLTFTNADLILRIKEQGAADWLFESSTKEDQDHNVPAVWTAPEAIKLLNKTYEWELYDSDIGTADDFIASGTFNAIGKARNGEEDGQLEVTDNNGTTQLVIYYSLKEEI
ncbi:MAG: hypothetical protein N4A35_09320 [Flavobacteriales bacterium]|jgi:hypothetical protein|nr:hypothetical protein [Flavobacteriales bacterium]